jgi:hypothetical protein
MYNLLSSNDRIGLFDSDISVNSHRAGLLPWESILELITIHYCRLQFKKYISGTKKQSRMYISAYVSLMVPSDSFPVCTRRCGSGFRNMREYGLEIGAPYTL